MLDFVETFRIFEFIFLFKKNIFYTNFLDNIKKAKLLFAA